MILVLVVIFSFNAAAFANPNMLFQQARVHFDRQQYSLAHEAISKGLHATQDASEKLNMGNFLLNIANVYYLNGQIKNAHTIFQELHDLFPSSHAILYSLGLALNELADYKTARNVFRKALQKKPDAIDIQEFLATVELALGNYEDGWQLYESRWKKPERLAFKMPCPNWDGRSTLINKKVVLINEGALGDCIQFIRYAQLIKTAGAYVIMQAPPSLKQLLSLCPFIDKIILNINEIDRCDYYASLMSLPAHFKTTLSTMPNTIPYLSCDSNLKTFWQKHIDSTMFNIGVCWQADVQNDANRPPLAKRAVPIELFDALAQLPNVKLYSLQKSITPPPFMHDFGSTLDTTAGAFMDSAAIITNLDLVISVDTSIAHLSGALGIPTWVILPFKADWRWLENDIFYSPWYPTMKLFRKKENEDWQSVIHQIKKELEHKIEKDSS